MGAVAGLEQQAERPPGLEQQVEPGLQLVRRLRLEPAAEAQQLALLGGHAGHADEGMGDNLEGLAGVPEHNHLRLGLDDRFGHHQAVAQGRGLAPCSVNDTVGPERREECDRESGGGGADQQGEQQHEPRIEGDAFDPAVLGQADGEHADTGDAGEQQAQKLAVGAANIVRAVGRLHDVPWLMRGLHRHLQRENNRQ